jgi:hypothetical protein
LLSFSLSQSNLLRFFVWFTSLCVSYRAARAVGTLSWLSTVDADTPAAALLPSAATSATTALPPDNSGTILARARGLEEIMHRV